MDDLQTDNNLQKDNNEKNIFQDVTDDGKTVTIYVRQMDNCMWELNLIGKANQNTSWSTWFPSATDAMQAGQIAILKEGIDEFYSIPEFSYLEGISD